MALLHLCSSEVGVALLHLCSSEVGVFLLSLVVRCVCPVFAIVIRWVCPSNKMGVPQ